MVLPLYLSGYLQWRRRFDEAISACQDAAAIFREAGRTRPSFPRRRPSAAVLYA
jgi:hypothetical protein